MEYAVTTFYKFTPLEERALVEMKQALEVQAKQGNILGLILIAPEGVNATLSGEEGALGQFKKFLDGIFGTIRYRDSVSDKVPFKRFKVKIKPEIVQLQRLDLRPTGSELHVSPEAWDEKVEKEDAVVIDVRNWYESKLGTFKNAVVPKTWTFSQFPAWLKKSGISKEKKIGIFCTGGIRCEKAVVAMKEQGYQHVFQLDGGILNYIEKRPNQNFTGDCFVFDHRSAVGQDLRPSRQYSLCANCGNAGDIDALCVHCQKTFRTCDDCEARMPVTVCSKNCRYLYDQLKTKSFAGQAGYVGVQEERNGKD